MRLALITAGLLLIPGMACAQSQEFRDAPANNWTVGVEPTFGFGSSEGFAEDSAVLIDESSFKTGFFWKIELPENFSIKVTPELGYSPNRYDTDAPSSAASLSFRLQHVENTSSARTDTGAEIKAQDTRTWFAEYRPAATHEDFLGDTLRREQTLGTGVTFSNIAYYLCGRGETPSPDPSSGNRCTQPGGLTYTFTPGLEFLDSSDDTRDLLKPYVSGRVSWPMWGRQFSFEAKGEGRFFDSATVPGGASREDYRVAATLSVVLWEQKTGPDQPWGLKIDLGVRYLRKWSNLDSAEGEEVLLVPGLGYTRQF